MRLGPISLDSPGQKAAAGVIALAVVLGGYALLHKRAAPPGTAPAIPVDVATATRADVPDNLEGLGTVQAFYTVTVTARVDGQIQRVAFKEGQHVRKGDLLVQIDPRPYQAALGIAIATRDKDRALLENARRDLERYEELAPEDLASKQTVDTQKALIAQLTAQVKGDEASIDNARTQLDYTTITSPIDGRTGIRLVDPGNNVRAADTAGMVVVTQLNPIAVMLSLPEEDFGALSAALARGPVPATALSRDDTDVLDTGTVELIDNQIDQTTGTIKVKAIMPNGEQRLWPGQFVNVRVLTQVRRQVLTVPASALERGPDGLFTYLVQPDSTLAIAPVTAGEPIGNLVVIDKGLKEGDRVVTSNHYRLQPGARISPTTAATADTPRRAPGEAHNAAESAEPAP